MTYTSVTDQYREMNFLASDCSKMFRWTLKQLGYVKENEKDKKVETKSNKNPNRRVSWHLQSAWKLHYQIAQHHSACSLSQSNSDLQ